MNLATVEFLDNNYFSGRFIAAKLIDIDISPNHDEEEDTNYDFNYILAQGKLINF